ncbi:MAG: transporter [Acidobacteriota bacterium]
MMTDWFRRRARLLALVVLPLVAAPASAQTTVSDVVGFLVTNQAVPTADFERDRAAAEAARDTISRALLVTLTSAPLATSSSGFLYRLNPQLGTVERATESFGAFFVERALTPGRGRSSFGVSANSAAFDQLNGQNLRDGTLLTVANRFRDESQPFDTESLTLKIRSSTMTVFGSIGVTDRLEIGGAVPFVRVSVEGQRVNVYRGTPLLQASATGTASGIADIALRAKYTLVSGQTGGVAAATEIRLPTGDQKNLLGTGSASYRFIGIGSLEQGRLALHGNASLLRGGISPEWSAAGAASVAAHPRVTISGEVLTRHVSSLHDFALSAAPHPRIVGVDTLRLTAGTAATTLASGVAGLKWNVTGTLVVGTHVSFPLAKRGLTAPITPSVGLEYAF